MNLKHTKEKMKINNRIKRVNMVFITPLILLTLPLFSHSLLCLNFFSQFITQSTKTTTNILILFSIHYVVNKKITTKICLVYFSIAGENNQYFFFRW